MQGKMVVIGTGTCRYSTNTIKGWADAQETYAHLQL